MALQVTFFKMYSVELTKTARKALLRQPRNERQLEELIDVHEANAVRERMDAGEEEVVPLELVQRISSGESPVKVWREHRGLSRQELADAIDIGDRALYMVEAGKRSPSTRTLRQLANRLNVDVDDLLPPEE